MRRVLLVPALLLLAGVAVVIVASFARSTSARARAAQNANSSTTTNRNANRSITPPAGKQEDVSKNTWELPADADKTPNPVQATEESIAKGKELFLEKMKGNCIFCHGETGSGNEANFGKLRRKPADLTNKERMTAMTDGEVFWKVTKGINGIMPAGENRLNEEERWHVVNYVRTLAKEK